MIHSYWDIQKRHWIIIQALLLCNLVDSDYAYQVSIEFYMHYWLLNVALTCCTEEKIFIIFTINNKHFHVCHILVLATFLWDLLKVSENSHFHMKMFMRFTRSCKVPFVKFHIHMRFARRLQLRQCLWLTGRCYRTCLCKRTCTVSCCTSYLMGSLVSHM